MEVLAMIILAVALLFVSCTIATAVISITYWVGLAILNHVIKKELPDAVQIVIGTLLFLGCSALGFIVAKTIVPILIPI